MLQATCKLLKFFQNPIKTHVRCKPYTAAFKHFLLNIPETRVTVLPNGLTVATEERECYNACVGFFIQAGSRYESKFENGIAHFFEHIAFKGTKTRAKNVLAEQMSFSGAQYYCFTTRELVVYYADCLCETLPLVLEILSDCVFNNSYCAADTEAQKNIVYAEMVDLDTNQNELVFNYLHSTAYQGTPLGQTIMGPTSNLHNFNSNTISQYVTNFFHPTRTVLVGVGGVKHEQILCLANAFVNKTEPAKCVDTGEQRFTGSDVRFRDDSTPQANVAIAVEGPSFADPDKIVMDVAAHIIGGWDKSQPGGTTHSTRVARAISTERVGEAYKAFNLNYNDTGLWGVQFMGQSLDLDNFLYIIQGEWMRLCTMVTDPEVERAKCDLKRNLLIKTESCRGTCHEMGYWLLLNGYRPSICEQIRKIDKIFAKDVREVCERYIYDRCPAVAAVGPTEGLSDYTRIRAGMYWLRV